MNPVEDRPVVVLAANVLFPFRKRDLLLRMYHAGLFQARWTARILDEWTRSLLERKPHLEASIRSQLSAMREHFGEALVSGYEPLIRTLDLPDADDRHVLAAAVRCGALRRAYRNPPFSPDGFILDLTAKGLPRLAALAEEHREAL